MLSVVFLLSSFGPCLHYLPEQVLSCIDMYTISLYLQVDVHEEVQRISERTQRLARKRFNQMNHETRIAWLVCIVQLHQSNPRSVYAQFLSKLAYASSLPYACACIYFISWVLMVLVAGSHPWWLN
jgi:hypothetical protein